MEMETILLQASQALLAILVPFFATQFCIWIGHMIGTQKLTKIKAELDAKSGFAYSVVLFVQQTAKELDAAGKFGMAEKYLVQSLQNAGLKVNINEVDILIESVLKTAKNSFGEEWNKISPPAGISAGTN